jgi:predicted NAD/FAD-binding protein
LKLAIVGTGISGLSAAWRLHERHDVRVFEREGRPGGHSHTVGVDDRGREVPVDTGFLVYDEVTYPNLVKLFSRLGVPTKASDMSFSVRCERCDLEWCGTGLSGVFAQRSNFLRPSFHGMLLEIARFNREAPGLLAEPGTESLTLPAYLDRERYGFRSETTISCRWRRLSGRQVRPRWRRSPRRLSSGSSSTTVFSV